MVEAQNPTMVRDRDDKGRIKETYPPETVLESLEEIDPAGTQEVAEEIGSSYETAFKKLKELESEGRVTSRKVGNALLWGVAE